MIGHIDMVAVANLVVSTITASCAIYIAFLALKHTTKPRINVSLLNARNNVIICNREAVFVFQVNNVGYWYGVAPAIDITVFCNFDPAFELKELKYGSVQEITDNHVRKGKGGLKFVRAEGIKLVRRGEVEQLHVVAKAPNQPGCFRVKVDAYSADGASFSRDYWVTCQLAT